LQTGCALRLRQVNFCLPVTVCLSGSSVAAISYLTTRLERVSSSPVRGPPQASGALGTRTAAASAPASGIAGQVSAGAVSAAVGPGAALAGCACAAIGSQAASAQARSNRLQGIRRSPGETKPRECGKTLAAATAEGQVSVLVFLELDQHVHVE